MPKKPRQQVLDELQYFAELEIRLGADRENLKRKIGIMIEAEGYEGGLNFSFEGKPGVTVF